METLEARYERLCATPSDINEHLATLYHYAFHVKHVTEFGVREGTSTTALLFSEPDCLVCYDLGPLPVIATLEALKGETLFDFRIGDSRRVTIDETDMLFIDTTHTGEHLREELTAHEARVRRFLAFHDTVTYGTRGENGGSGLLGPIYGLVRSGRWKIVHNSERNNGLIVLERV